MAIFHDGMPEVTQSGSLTRTFLVQPSIRICPASGAPGIDCFSPWKSTQRLAWFTPSPPESVGGSSLALEALEAGRGFDQRAIPTVKCSLLNRSNSSACRTTSSKN